ncbi:MAG TPA: peptidoglycan DD-metalloendopeptidase family protein [Caulobacteraceae bacterium]|nr:peptidoglycan DD-metalloendopeptidase family protein [Caulobacteraceae bacterium]
MSPRIPARRRSAVFVGVMLAALCRTAIAQQPRAPTPEDLARLQQELKSRELERQELQSQAQAARAQIGQLNLELAKLSLNEAQGQLTVNDKKMRLAQMSVQETELAVRVGANKNRLAHMLGALQMYSRNPPPALLVHPQDAKDAVRAAILIRAVTPELEKRARRYAAEVDQARKLRRDVATGSAELFTAESVLADQKSKLEQMIAEKTELERQLASGVLIADRQIADIAGRAQTLGKLLGGLPTQASANASLKPAVLKSPTVGAPVSRFGEQSRDGDRSEGWTWRPPAGSAVAAPSSGLIEFAGPLYGWGQVLIMRLAGDYHVVLAGMDQITVKPGQSVAEGQPIGRMANNAQGEVGSGLAELYLEVRNGNRPVDPAQFLR